MSTFLKEYWLWILTPMVLIVTATVVVALMQRPEESIFTYSLF